tara:strand:+ start:182 stop:346 length:165 start_codon:yes stop_codon:yes gene_type:complete
MFTSEITICKCVHHKAGGCARIFLQKVFDFGLKVKEVWNRYRKKEVMGGASITT